MYSQIQNMMSIFLLMCISNTNPNPFVSPVKTRIGQIQGRKFGTQAISEFHGRQGIHASELVDLVGGFGGVGGVSALRPGYDGKGSRFGCFSQK